MFVTGTAGDFVAAEMTQAQPDVFIAIGVLAVLLGLVWLWKKISGIK